jgi:DNA uptake protein ComE-like DNA-binding protein
MKLVRALAFGLVLAASLFGQSAASSKSAPKAAAADQKSATIDINHASVAELKSLPGIGDAYANAIVKHRPYANKTQLRSRNVLPLSTYNKIKDQVIAKQ